MKKVHHLVSWVGLKRFLVDLFGQSPGACVLLLWASLFVLPTVVSVLILPQSLVVPIWFATGTAVMLLLMCCHSHRWCVRLIEAVVPNAIPVKIMDFEGDTVHTVVFGSFGKPLRGFTYWYFCIGPVQLMPNGLVKSGYQYFWQPLHTDLACEMALAWDLPSWNKLTRMNMHERDNCRQMLMDQAKLMYEQFDI